MKPATLPCLRSSIVAVVLALAASCASLLRSPAHAGATTIHGYVLDSACAYIKNLDKPVSKQCAIDCAQAGSPLVILADDGTIYLPISSAMPAVGMNSRLLEFAGDRVVVTGQSYRKGGSLALVIDKIEHEARAKS